MCRRSLDAMSHPCFSRDVGFVWVWWESFHALAR